MKIILLGAPGAGKGTQAQFISEKTGAVPISTGKLIRAAVKNGTPCGNIAKEYIDVGKLVPNEIVIEMLKERLSEDDCKDGYILDGFPRNISQALALEKMGIEVDIVIDILVFDSDVIERLCGRRVCNKCGATYHVNSKPSAKGEQCELCDGILITREDDKPEIVLERLRVYHSETEPLLRHYNAQIKLRTMRCFPTIEDTAKGVLAILGEPAVPAV